MKATLTVLNIYKALLQLCQGCWVGRQLSLNIHGYVHSVLLLPGAGKMQVMSCIFTLAATKQNSSCQMHVAISVCAADTEEVTVYLLEAASSLHSSSQTQQWTQNCLLFAHVTRVDSKLLSTVWLVLIEAVFPASVGRTWYIWLLNMPKKFFICAKNKGGNSSLFSWFLFVIVKLRCCSEAGNGLWFFLLIFYCGTNCLLGTQYS